MTVVFRNIPIINLLNEFREYYRIFQDRDFVSQFKRRKILPIKAPGIIWLRMPNDFLTFVLQRIFLGFESYLYYAIWHKGHEMGIYSDIKQYSEDPFRLGGSLVEVKFDKLPAKIKEEYSLRNYNKDLYSKTEKIYKEVRNPLFHGKQITSGFNNEYFSIVKHFYKLYQWVDTWGPKEI
jgi:hypothetical protein